MSMVSKFPYFPEIYPGESLYSLIARYHSNSIGNSCKDTLEEIFGSRSISVSQEFPTHLHELSRRLNSREISKEILLYQHTLYPFMNLFCMQMSREI